MKFFDIFDKMNIKLPAVSQYISFIIEIGGIMINFFMSSQYLM